MDQLEMYSINWSKLASVEDLSDNTSHVLHRSVARTLNKPYPSRRVCCLGLCCICYKYKTTSSTPYKCIQLCVNCTVYRAKLLFTHFIHFTEYCCSVSTSSCHIYTQLHSSMHLIDSCLQPTQDSTAAPRITSQWTMRSHRLSTQLSRGEKTGLSASVINHTIITDPTIPTFDPPHHTWSLPNHFQTYLWMQSKARSLTTQ